jgi:hypothetical protein
MDLGSLELQIFVSLTVVLGGAFVALVCDYLKGNNEQLREYNIELRVRKEEQERRLLLDPAGEMRHMQQTLGVAPTVAAAPQPQARPAAPHEVMQSFADPQALADAEARAARLHARYDEEDLDTAAIPPLTQRRTKQRGDRAGKRKERPRGEEYGSWVRPEVLARVARRAEATSAYSSDIREEVEAVRERDESLPKPLNPPDNWDIREELPARAKAEPPAPPVKPAAETVAAPEPMPEGDKVRLQKEIERVSQLQRQPVAPAPGTILRPLTVPALRLEEELQRVAQESDEEKKQEELVPASWTSPLLDEVIAASTAPPEEPAAVIEIDLAPEIEPAVLEPSFVVEPAAAIEVAPEVAPEVVPEVALEAEPEVVAEPEPVEEIPAGMAEVLLGEYVLSAAGSRLSGMGISGDLDFLVTAPDLHKPTSGLALAELPAVAEEPESVELQPLAAEPLPDLLPAFADSVWEPEVLTPEPPPIWEPAVTGELIDISVARTLEPEIPAAAATPAVPDLLIPAGMHDASTWNRLLSLPNPLTGILFVIELRSGESAPVIAEPMPDQAEAIDKLIASFVREGDFGSRIGENEWVFIYSHDAAGFNQRRIGMIPEKLWDFQLRHLGTANLTFKWGAVDVKSEPLGASLEAARARMNQTRRSRKLPGADVMAGRRVVNG